MNEKTVLFFDVDGTLFCGSKKCVLPSTIKALDLLKEKGYDLFLSTGRSHQTLGMINDFLHYFNGLNLSNGQEIILNNEVIYEKFIELDIVLDVMKYADNFKVSVAMITRDYVYINYFTEESYKNYTDYVKTKALVLNDKPFNRDDCFQIWLFASNDIVKKFKERFENLEVINWGGYGADIIPKHSSKAKGIEILKEKLGYQTKNMYAFGDGDNDVEMFKIVGTSVCMGNGSTKAKESATFITNNIQEEGLYNALIKLKLIGEEHEDN